MEGQNDEFVQRELSAEPVSSAEVSYMGFYRTTEPRSSTALRLRQNQVVPALVRCRMPRYPPSIRYCSMPTPEAMPRDS